MAKDASQSDIDNDEAITNPPKRRAKRVKAADSGIPFETDDDDALEASINAQIDEDAPVKKTGIVRDSGPPRLVIADVDFDDEDDEPPAKPVKRARRRPRAEHVSTPPQRASDLEGDVTAPEQPASKKKAPLAKKKQKAKASTTNHLWFEVMGIVLLALSVLLLLSLVSYTSTDTAVGVTKVKNWIGPGGALLADIVLLVLGVSGFLLPFLFVLLAIPCFKPIASVRHATLRTTSAIAAVLSAMTLLHLMFASSTVLPFPAGGLVGAMIGDGVSSLVAPLGCAVLALATLFVTSLVAIDRPVGHTTRSIGDALVAYFNQGREQLAIWREERRLLAEEADALRAQMEPDTSVPPLETEAELKAKKLEEENAKKLRIADEASKRAMKKLQALDDTAKAKVTPEAPIVTAVAADPAKTVIDSDPAWVLDEPVVDGNVIALAKVMEKKKGTLNVTKPKAEVKQPEAPAVSNVSDVVKAAVDAVEADDNAFRIVERAAVAPVIVDEEEPPVVVSSKQEYQLPPLNLLDYDAPAAIPLDENKMRAQADKLIAKFRDFGIDGRVREVRPGPVCTTYEFVPAPGIKVSKIAALADDIAMAMEAIHVRIVAPIPGKGAVGIEIPNEKRETVYMKEIVADEQFSLEKTKNHKLMMALGKDIEGRPYYANLAEMPHVLISGTTGSGKSVSVNAMICSMLYRATPEDVRFIMIDPKMLELSIYDGIPHLLLPPIIDSKKAAVALKWAVNEMERRYQLMSELGVRDIIGYNQRILEAREGRDDEAKRKVTELFATIGGPQGKSNAIGGPLDKLPYLVIVVDEYADLLAVAGKDVEGYIMRLAQKARAAGLHVMLATQRPSVDVITGVIKANFPVRMGFRLASSHDSKTIINRPGAEKLLGRGDMLFMPPGTSNVLRVHGAFISEKELHRVVDFLKAQAKATYDMSILDTPLDDSEGTGGGGAEMLDEPKDARFDEALAVVARTRKCSTSWLQRTMNLGYQRAARIVDRMEREGLVGPAQNAKGDREIFVKPEGAQGQ